MILAYLSTGYLDTYQVIDNEFLERFKFQRRASQLGAVYLLTLLVADSVLDDPNAEIS